MTAIAIIPARGGSKRVPRKNIRPFLGRSMIEYPIRLALGCGHFDRVVVSTDDAEIAQIARAAGAETPFRRPAELADDHAGTRPVIVQALDALAGSGDPDAAVIACIYPCTPLLREGDLDAAMALLQTAPADCFVFPVVRLPIPIERALRRDASGRARPVEPGAALMRSQDLEPAWRDAGQFYLGRSEAWRGERLIFDGALTTVLPAERAVDIDSEEDWQLAETIAAALATPNDDIGRD